MIGQTLAHFRITAALGAGGMGEVYRATDTRLGREVALKVLPAEMAANPERLDRFRREATLLAALDHPGIVTVHSVEESEGLHFLTMQLVEGEPLDRLIPEGGLGVDRILGIGTAVAEALAAAHDKGIIHRDLKPANVMVTKDGRVKVLDFGLAKIAASQVDEPLNSEMATDLHTREGVVMGTMPYMSPEQISGRAVDQQTDIFSLGVMLYEMATGHRPFEGQSSAELASAILRDTPRPLAELRNDLPPGLADVIGRCLEKNATERWPTARDLREALGAVSSDPTSVRMATGSGTSMTRADEGFWVAVLPFKAAGDNSDLVALADGLFEEVVTGLSRFSYLRVIASSSTSQYANQAHDVRTVGRELGARYVMEGSLRLAGSKLRVAAQLVDTESGANLWAETYERDFASDQVFALQDDLVPRIVSTCGDHFGVLARAISEAVRGKPLAEITPYEALMRGFGYHFRLSPDEHAKARDVLESSVEQAPANADCWAMLSWVYSHEFAHDFNPRPGSLDRALEAARKAVDLAPSNHLAQQVLAVALFFRKETAACLSAAERAMALNPYDGSNEAIFLITFSGDWDRGCALIRRAMELNPHHPPWYQVMFSIDEYRKENYRAAVDEAVKANASDIFWTNWLLAAAHGQLGEHRAARKALDNLLVQKEDFATSGRQLMEKWFEPLLVDRFVDGLRKAGLDVEAPEAADSAAVAPVGQAPADAGVGERRKGLERLWILTAAVVAIAVAVFLWMRTPEDRVAVEVPRLAVLPFADLSSGGDQEWIAAGTHEALLTALQQIGGLRVTSRTSSSLYRETTLPLREIARELGVGWLVEGSVTRVGDRMRVAAQLVEGSTDQQVWAGQYEGDVRDILALQNEVARAIAAEVHVVVTPEEDSRLARVQPVDPAAYRAYINGLHHFDRVNPADFNRSIQLFEESIAIDPAFAPAHAALASAYGLAVEFGFVSMAVAAPLAERAVSAVERLDPGSADAYRSLANVQFHIRRDFKAAEANYLKAEALESNAYALFEYGWLLSQSGRHTEAVAALEKVVALDPRSPLFRGDLGWWSFGARDYDRAIEEAKFALELDPSFPEPHWLLAVAYAELGRYDEALTEIGLYESMYGGSMLWYRGYILALAGRRDEALRALEELEASGAPAAERAYTLLGLGDRDGVLTALEEAESPSVALQPYLWPGYEAYHDDSRFRAVLAKFGLPLPGGDRS